LSRNPAEADRLASDLIELSTRHNYSYWLAQGRILRGWARSASGNAAEGIPWIEQGLRDVRATGRVLGVPGLLGRKAEALYLGGRTSEPQHLRNAQHRGLINHKQVRVFRPELES